MPVSMMAFLGHSRLKKDVCEWMLSHPAYPELLLDRKIAAFGRRESMSAVMVEVLGAQTTLEIVDSGSEFDESGILQNRPNYRGVNRLVARGAPDAVYHGGG